MVGAPPEQVVVGENASLAMMHDCLVWALTKGVPGGTRPWGQEPGGVAFLCPVPGYDRHFAITEGWGVRMIPVPLTGEGPDMAAVTEAVKDPSVKGMWCVPKYSNPTGETYATHVVEALAAMETGAPDFRLFWDNAYAVHDLVPEGDTLADVLDACAGGGQPRTRLRRRLDLEGDARGRRPRLLRRVARERRLVSRAGRPAHDRPQQAQPAAPRALLRRRGRPPGPYGQAPRAAFAPKFAAVEDALAARLAGTGAATWAKPRGGYFVSVDVRPGTAKRVVALAKTLGVAMTPAGATWPGGVDPHDSNLRIAPSFPSLPDVAAAAEGIALAILASAVEAEQQARGEGGARRGSPRGVTEQRARRYGTVPPAARRCASSLASRLAARLARIVAEACLAPVLAPFAAPNVASQNSMKPRPAASAPSAATGTAGRYSR